MAAPNETLFVGDIPHDADKSVIENAFSAMSGFKSCRVRLDKFGHTVAFVEFTSIPDAVAAKDALTGLLRVNATAPPVSISFSRGGAGGEKRQRDDYGGGGGGGRPGPGGGGPFGPGGGGGGPGGPVRFAPDFGGGGPSGHSGSPGVGPPPPQQQQQRTAAHTSLFIEGVPDDASERETAHVFRPFYGYRGLRFAPRKERPGRLCFVDFDTPEQAASAMDSLQGYVFDLKQPELHMRVQFASGSRQPAPQVGGMYSGSGGVGPGMLLLGGAGLMQPQQQPAMAMAGPPQGMYQVPPQMGVGGFGGLPPPPGPGGYGGGGYGAPPMFPGPGGGGGGYGGPPGPPPRNRFG